MKNLLIVVSEYGALTYIYPVIQKLLINYNVTLVSNLDIKSFFKRKQIKYKFSRNLEVKILNNENKESLEYFDCIISSATSKKLEHDIMLNSKSLKIKTIQFVDNVYGWNKRLTYKGTTIFPDYLCVVDKKCIKYAIKEGIPDEIIYPVGNPAWEKTKYKFNRLNRKTLFIGTPLFQIYRNELGYTEKDVWQMCIRAEKKYPNLILGLNYLLHPNQDIPPYINKNRIIKKVEKINHYGQIIGIYSAFLTEALLVRKNVISIQPNNFKEDKWIISKYFNIKYAKNYREFIKILKRGLRRKAFFTFEKNSCENIIKLINKITLN